MRNITLFRGKRSDIRRSLGRAAKIESMKGGLCIGGLGCAILNRIGTARFHAIGREESKGA